MEPLARLGVQHRARHASVPRWFIHICGNELRGVGDRVVTVEIFALDEGIYRGFDDFVRWDTP